MTGGEGKVVKIDKSQFGKRKYHQGHYVQGQWVFDGVDRGNSRTFLDTAHGTSSETRTGSHKTLDST